MRKKTCQFSIAEFIVRWPGGVFMMPVKIHFFRVSIWKWMWKKHFSIFSEFTYRTYESKFRQETSSNPLYLWFASCHPVVFLHHKHHVRPCGWAVEVSMLPWNWVNWAKGSLCKGWERPHKKPVEIRDVILENLILLLNLLLWRINHQSAIKLEREQTFG